MICRHNFFLFFSIIHPFGSNNKLKTTEKNIQRVESSFLNSREYKQPICIIVNVGHSKYG